MGRKGVCHRAGAIRNPRIPDPGSRIPSWTRSVGMDIPRRLTPSRGMLRVERWASPPPRRTVYPRTPSLHRHIVSVAPGVSFFLGHGGWDRFLAPACPHPRGSPVPRGPLPAPRAAVPGGCGPPAPGGSGVPCGAAEVDGAGGPLCSHRVPRHPSHRPPGPPPRPPPRLARGPVGGGGGRWRRHGQGRSPQAPGGAAPRPAHPHLSRSRRLPCAPPEADAGNRVVRPRQRHTPLSAL